MTINPSMHLRCRKREFAGTGVHVASASRRMHRRHLYVITQAKAGGSVFSFTMLLSPGSEIEHDRSGVFSPSERKKFRPKNGKKITEAVQ